MPGLHFHHEGSYRPRHSQSGGSGDHWTLLVTSGHSGPRTSMDQLDARQQHRPPLRSARRFRPSPRACWAKPRPDIAVGFWNTAPKGEIDCLGAWWSASQGHRGEIEGTLLSPNETGAGQLVGKVRICSISLRYLR